MKLVAMELHDFRNIASLQLQASEQVNVIHGENAQGKTNLIEAIWLFTGDKSFRGAKDREMIRFGQNRGSVAVTFSDSVRQESAKIELFAPETAAGGEKRTKSVQLNGVPLESAAELAGTFYAVVFSPAHLSLVREGPAFRRKFLDTAIAQLMPKYGYYLREYQRILLQRNTLLKDLVQFPQLRDTMDVWEEALAKAAAAVAFCRARYVERICPKVAQVYEGISSGRETMDLKYQCGLPDAHQYPREQLRAFYLEQLRRDRESDIQHGSTRCGPHRDDLEILVNGMPARLYGSQGQQRSSVLAMKMAECSMVEETTGEAPIVLLDDVMSELDAGRRDYLLNHLENRQVFVTCCDDESFRQMQSGRSFLIEGGQLQKIEDF